MKTFLTLTLTFFMFDNIIRAQECTTPAPTEWKNYYENDLTKSRQPASYYIQFLSVKHDNPVNVPFNNYIIVKDGCYRRFYVDIQFENLEAALEYLPTVKQFYPDAFPIMKTFKALQ
jgi:hypothetical protein